MKHVRSLRLILSAVSVAALLCAPAIAAEHKSDNSENGEVKEKKPKAPKKSVCDNKLLYYQQHYLCGQQTAQAQTKPELKKVEERFNNIVRDIERKQKEGHE